MAETAVPGSPLAGLASLVRALLRTLWRVDRRHLSEDRLLALASSTSRGGQDTTPTNGHLSSCLHCQARYRDAAVDLKAIADAATANFDAVFSPAVLDSQRTRIGRRLERLVGAAAPARVIGFPFAGAPRPLQRQPAGWVPAALVGALLLGLTAGQFIQLPGLEVASDAGPTASAILGAPQTPLPTPRSAPVGARVTSAPGRASDGTHLDMTGTVELPPLAGDDTGPLTLDEFALVMFDEEFLGRLDTALTSTQVSELASIDALTPRVRDFAINIR